MGSSTLVSGAAFLILAFFEILYGWKGINATSYLIQHNAASPNKLLNTIKFLYIAILLLTFYCSFVNFLWYFSQRKKRYWAI